MILNSIFKIKSKMKFKTAGKYNYNLIYQFFSDKKS